MKIIIKHYSVARLARIGMLLLFAAVMGSCGGGGGCAGVVKGVNTCTSSSGATAPGAISLIFSNTELKSAGAMGTEVTITATVKTAGNVALSGVPVNFTADSGNLTVLSAVTDANGLAKAQIGTAGNHVNRIITVTAQAGSTIATGTIAVVGTTVTATGPASITLNTTGNFTVTVKDSLGAPVAGVPVTFSSALGNAIVAAAPLTNSTGQVVFRLTGTNGPTDTLSFASQGANGVQSVAISSSSLTVTTFDNVGNIATQASTGSSGCTRITAHYVTTAGLGSGSVNISTSRGNMYSDSGCAVALPGPVPITSGDSTATYVSSTTAGVATINATVVSGGPSAQTNLEFIAPLTPVSTITLQADPTVIGPNSGTGQAQQSTLTAIVRDGNCNSSPCNLVKNAPVVFTIVSDPGGGTLSNTSPVTTGSNGAAVTTYIAGPAGTPTNGVVVTATIQGAPITTASATATLTVSRQALFISAGTSNTLIPIDPIEYQQQYLVRVSDASGNAVAGVAITGSIIPTRYWKGYYSPTATGWTQNFFPTLGCVNEDTNRNGQLDPGEDINNNQKLDPGIPLGVTPNAVTGADGTAIINVTYPRDRAYWLEVTMTLTGSVAGSESIYQTTFILPGLAADYVAGVSPPGNPSPYGQATACTNKL